MRVDRKVSKYVINVVLKRWGCLGMVCRCCLVVVVVVFSYISDHKTDQIMHMVTGGQCCYGTSIMHSVLWVTYGVNL